MLYYTVSLYTGKTCVIVVKQNLQILLHWRANRLVSRRRANPRAVIRRRVPCRGSHLRRQGSVLSRPPDLLQYFANVLRHLGHSLSSSPRRPLTLSPYRPLPPPKSHDNFHQHASPISWFRSSSPLCACSGACQAHRCRAAAFAGAPCLDRCPPACATTGAPAADAGSSAAGPRSLRPDG